MARIDEKEAGLIFENISREYKITAPVEKIGKGRFSGTHLLTYDDVKNFGEIQFFKKTFFSAKSVLFPVRETMFKFRGHGMEEAREEILPRIVFLRACDINAVAVMDAHFLKTGGCEDPYYKRCREAVKIFLMECESPFDNCFCVSMGTNKTEDYSVCIRKVGDGYEIHVKDDAFQKYFPARMEEDEGPAFVKKDPRPIPLPDEIDVSIFKSKIWKDYSLRCTACGRCNTSCPTCTCFTLQDLPSEDETQPAFDKESTWLRRRIWSSCQVKNFSLLAGSHDFRIPNGDRMRYRVLHKIRDFRKRHGFDMCVGCGRCDDVCPEYISMFKCIEKINKINGKKR